MQKSRNSRKFGHTPPDGTMKNQKIDKMENSRLNFRLNSFELENKQK